jgi:RNA polymerase II subunit A small phosphatase-like protein
MSSPIDAQPRKLLLLDLDETLVFVTEKPLDRPPDFEVFPYHVYLRPYLTEFVAGVLTEFDVALWSAAGERYVREISDRIFPAGALKFVWSAKRCTLTKDWKNGGYQTRKHLKKVKARGYPFESILAVDDKPTNFARSFGNVVAVQPFNGNEGDDELRHLLNFLLSIKDVPDVRVIEKRNWRNQVDSQH